MQGASADRVDCGRLVKNDLIPVRLKRYRARTRGKGCQTPGEWQYNSIRYPYRRCLTVPQQLANPYAAYCFAVPLARRSPPNLIQALNRNTSSGFFATMYTMVYKRIRIDYPMLNNRMGRLLKFRKDDIDEWVNTGGAADTTRQGQAE